MQGTNINRASTHRRFRFVGRGFNRDIIMGLITWALASKAVLNQNRTRNKSTTLTASQVQPMRAFGATPSSPRLSLQHPHPYAPTKQKPLQIAKAPTALRGPAWL